MPQCKGSATWLTNVRQEVTHRRAGIDQSAAKIENGRIEEDMRRTLDSIHLAQHRAKADREYEMREAKSRNHQATHNLSTENTSGESSPRRRRARGLTQSAGPTRTDDITARRRNPALSQDQQRPQTVMAGVRRGGFASADPDFDEEDADDDESPRGSNSKPKGKRPQSKMPPRRPRQKFIGRSLREIRKSLYDEFTNISEGDQQGNKETAAHHNEGHTSCSRPWAVRLREKREEEQQFQLQQKLKAFYRDLELFKGSPNKHNPKMAFTYVYTYGSPG